MAGAANAPVCRTRRSSTFTILAVIKIPNAATLQSHQTNGFGIIPSIVLTPPTDRFSKSTYKSVNLRCYRYSLLSGRSDLSQIEAAHRVIDEFLLSLDPSGLQPCLFLHTIKMLRSIGPLCMFFLLLDVCYCQFFVNGRYGKRSQESAGTSDLEGLSSDMASSSGHDSTLPRMYCFYTGYQSLYNCRSYETFALTRWDGAMPEVWSKLSVPNVTLNYYLRGCEVCEVTLRPV